MEILELRNLFSTYDKVNKSERNEIFYNEFNNNLIVFAPYNKTCNTESICNGISQEAYQFLTNILNTTKNIIVKWSQVEGTTSDYDIYYDLNPEKMKSLSYKRVTESLKASVDDGFSGMKYNFVKERKFIPIKREEMAN